MNLLLQFAESLLKHTILPALSKAQKVAQNRTHYLQIRPNDPEAIVLDLESLWCQIDHCP